MACYTQRTLIPHHAKARFPQSSDRAPQIPPATQANQVVACKSLTVKVKHGRGHLIKRGDRFPGVLNIDV